MISIEEWPNHTLQQTPPHRLFPEFSSLEAGLLGLFVRRQHHTMSNITLNLVVLRSLDVARAAAFYTRLGLQFSQHRHGGGPEHFAAKLPGGVFELYPLSPDGSSTLGTRIGFRVPSVDSAIAALSDYPGAVVTSARDSEWGRRAVVADPDGHRVELLQS